MAGCFKMLSGMLVLRAVAAADVSAGQAQAQVHPRVSRREALLAAVGRAGCDRFVYLAKMGAGSVHRDSIGLRVG